MRRRTGTWWDTGLLVRWVALNGLAYVVVIVAGVALEQLFAGAAEALAVGHWLLATTLVAVLGAGVHGFVVGSLQWTQLRHRLTGLTRRRWVTATFLPALVLWLMLLAPEAVHTVTDSGSTLRVFRDAFAQALILGPLVGLAQAVALRGHTSRWMWWFVANVTTYLFGASTYQVGDWLLDGLPVSGWAVHAFPLLAFGFHGVWMLWVTDPRTAQSDVGPTRRAREHGRHAQVR